MSESFFSELIQNISLLLVFSFLYGQNWVNKITRKKLSPKIYAGLIVGTIGILLMYTPWTYVPGIVFDTRSILLAISGLFLGLIPTFIAVILTSLYRLFIGGDGVIMGIAVILSSGIIGFIWRLYFRRLTETKPIISLLILGFIVHIVMLACTFFLPENKTLLILKTISVPVLTIYPFSTMLLGVLMNYQFANWQNRKAKEILVESERRFTDMLTNIKMLSLIIDTNQNIVFCNNHLLEITGYSSDEVIGKNWFELFLPPEEKNRVANTYFDLLKGKNNSYHFENDIITKQKVKLTISWNNIYLKDEKGEINGTASIGENITEKKHALEIIKKSEDKFNRLFHSSPDAITLSKLSNRLIVDVNDSACTLTGYSREELLGKPILSNLFWNNETELKKYSNLIAKHKKVVNFEAQFKMKHKQIKTALVSGEVIPIQDELYVIGVIRDITQRKATEIELLNKNTELANNIQLLKQLNIELNFAKEKAEESNRLKTVFLQNISHEIRTPMNGILGFLSLLKDSGRDIDKRNNYIDIVNKSGARLLNTVNDLIEISKIETNQISIQKSTVNVLDIMQEYYVFYNALAKEKGLVLNFNGNNITDNIIIQTDKHLFDGIISNLLSNALKFTKKGFIEIGGKLNQKTITFYVSDSGIGIPENRIEAIFERFVQANMDIAREHEGAGLGLAISKSYAKILGGKLWVESIENKGSTFYFEIPTELIDPNKNSEETSKKKSEENVVTINEKCKILIAEDDEISYLYLEYILNDDKITLIHVTNGIEAVEKIKNDSEICLILMDIKMPLLSGIEAAKKIREFNKTIPIISQTAYATAEDKDKLLNIGFTDYISKPIDKASLISLIKKYIKKN